MFRNEVIGEGGGGPGVSGGHMVLTDDSVTRPDGRGFCLPWFGKG
jgi:hypothetical protein